MAQRQMEKAVSNVSKKPNLTGKKLASDKEEISWRRQIELDTALLDIVTGGNKKEIVRLIKEGAKITATDYFHKTTLHMVAGKGNAETCALLISEYAKAGGDVKELITAKNVDGWIALHIAAREGLTQNCALIIQEYAKAGGDVKELITAKDNEGKIPLNYATTNTTNNRHTKIAHFLKSIEWLTDAAGNAFMKSFMDCIG